MCIPKSVLFHTKKIPHCTPKFCDLCEQVFEIGPGFKVHTAFHEISVNEKLSFAILNQSSCTQQFTRFYSKTVCKLCEQVFAIGSGFNDHTAFHKFSGVNANPSYVMSSALFHKKSKNFTPKPFVTCVGKFDNWPRFQEP